MSTKKPLTRIVTLNCNHSKNVEETGGEETGTAGLCVGDSVCCNRCGRYETIVWIMRVFRVRCKNCTYGRTYESFGEARAGARGHMLRKRHTVMAWEHGITSTLEVFQPATSDQLTLGNEAPF
jgi:hypothetical protein